MAPHQPDITSETCIVNILQDSIQILLAHNIFLSGGTVPLNNIFLSGGTVPLNNVPGFSKIRPISSTLDHFHRLYLCHVENMALFVI